jgi:hypothetical protein
VDSLQKSKQVAPKDWRGGREVSKD